MPAAFLGYVEAIFSASSTRHRNYPTFTVSSLPGPLMLSTFLFISFQEAKRLWIRSSSRPFPRSFLLAFDGLVMGYDQMAQVIGSATDVGKDFF